MVVEVHREARLDSQTAQQRQWHGEMLELDRRSTSHAARLAPLV